MWLLLPILILVAVMWVLGSLFVGMFWLVGNAWPLLLIGLGAWLFWHEDGRHARGRRGSRKRMSGWMATSAPAAVQPPVASEKTASSPEKAVSRPEKSKKLRQVELPVDLRVKVEQIVRKVDVLLGYADRFPPFSQDLYLVRQTATDYLPRTVDTYLALPPETVDVPLGPNGNTPKQELKAQLDLLDAKLDEIAQDLQRQDADRLLANRRFLEARFGSAGEEAKEESVPV